MSLRALEPWLAERVDIKGTLTAKPMLGGRSNLTFELADQENRYVLRRPPLGDVLNGAHDIVREYGLIKSLQGTKLPVSRAIGACEDPGLIGAPFSVVAFVEGVTLRTPSDLAQIPPESRTALTANFAAKLAQLHSAPTEVAGLPTAKGQDFVARQLHVWQRQLRAQPTRYLPIMDKVAAGLKASIPEQEQVSIVHGDYRLDNVILSRTGEVLAVVDWELWTLGDPLADLGIAVTYWQESTFEIAPLGLSPTSLGALGNRREFLTSYEAAGGRQVDEDRLAWYVAFGTWRFAAILEGVYRRNLMREDRDEGEETDWRQFSYIVPALAEVALQHLDSAL